MKFLYSITICYYWDRFGRIQSSNRYPFSYQIDAHRTRHASTCVDAFLAGDEARTTAAQTLEVVYGLVQNMKVVIDGEQTPLACLLLAVHIFPCRWQSIDRECPGFPWYILLMT